MNWKTVARILASLVLGLTYLTRHGLWKYAVEWAERQVQEAK